MPEGLSRLLTTEEDAIVAECVGLVHVSSAHFIALGEDSIARTSRQLLRLIADLHRNPDCPETRQAVRTLCEARIPTGFGLGEVMEGLFIYNRVVLPRIRAAFADQPDLAIALVSQFRVGVERLAALWAEEYHELQVRLLDRQAQVLRQLSTPVLQVWDGLLALPLIGDVNDQRARQVTEELLKAVVETQSDIVLIDITGLGDINTAVIAQLLRTHSATLLLGAQLWIVGLSPEVAQSIVELGADLQQITTYATLQQGLAEAFRVLGLRISKGGRLRPTGDLDVW